MNDFRFLIPRAAAGCGVTARKLAALLRRRLEPPRAGDFLARAARLLKPAPFLLAAAVAGSSNSLALADEVSSASSKVFDVRGFAFHDGQTMPTVRLHYQTLGEPHRDARGEIDNAVLLLHGTGQEGSEFLAPSFARPLFGAGEPLDAAKFFLIMPDSVGHGQSSKPSDGLRARFPKYDYADMVSLQHRLVVEGLGVRRLRLILGTSMGCMHTYVWGETFPDEMRALMTMSCSPFPVAGLNWLWRKGLIDAITLDPDWRRGNYRRQPTAAMRSVVVLTGIAVNGAPNLAERFPTQAGVDSMIRAETAGALKLADANDILYQFSASSGYDAWPALDRIKVPVLWWDSADDFINPPTLPYPSMALKRMPNFRYVLLPASAETNGHMTFMDARFFAGDVSELLARSDASEAAPAAKP